MQTITIEVKGPHGGARMEVGSVREMGDAFINIHRTMQQNERAIAIYRQQIAECHAEVKARAAAAQGAA